MSREKHAVPARVLAFLLSFLVALCLLLVPLGRAVLDRGLWRASAEVTLPQQQEAARTGIEAVAAALPFRPETALAFYPPQRLAELSRAGADWLFSLVSGEQTPLPDFSAEELTEAILADSLYEAEGPAVQRRQIARDEGAYGVERAVTRGVMPLRVSLLATAARRLPLGKAARLLRLGALALVGLTVLTAAAMLRLRKRKLLGSALSGGALGALFFLIPLALLDIPGRAGALSPVFGAQCGVFLRGLAGTFLWGVGAAALLGLALTILPLGRKNHAA
ncbi:MAG: hypothetical protein IKH77_01865 [Clostridia bacterium]|nr:hypothetical protein [Clostridia bacterium]